MVQGGAGVRAIVTGAARGLGRAFALALAEDGARVLAADIDEAGAAETAAACGAGALAVRCDVTSEADGEAAVAVALDAFGGLDALVNNAGIVSVTRAPAREIPAGEWDRVMAVNAKGAWLMARAAIPALIESRGAMVNLASEVAFTGSHHLSHYVASKAAVVGLTYALARELGPHGVRVNAIAPGYTDTEGARGIGDPATYDASATPLRRMGQPEDMVGTLRYLLGPGSGFVTGQVILVGGGRTTR
jgi:NAD(P)-dependent dehydrogenase (short-subunit alcohol dehydrogenase family)